VIGPDSVPRLAAKARLRFDGHGRQYVLLYPERGLALNATAAAILELCTGERSVAAIVERLHARHPRARPAAMLADVCAFLDDLRIRGVLADAADPAAPRVRRDRPPSRTTLGVP